MKEINERFKNIKIKKEIKDRLDSYMARIGKKMSYGELIDYMCREGDITILNDVSYEEVLIFLAENGSMKEKRFALKILSIQ